MADEIREIKTIITIDMAKAASDAKTYQDRVEALKRKLLELVNAGHSFASAQNAIKTQLKQTKIEALEAAEALGGAAKQLKLTEAAEGVRNLEALPTALREAKDEMGLLGGETSKAAKILERTFAAAIIGVVLNALRSFINGLQEAIQKGAEFRETLVDLSVAAGAFGDGSFGDWQQVIDDASKQFTQFTKKDLQDGVAELLDLARVAELSSDQVKQLVTDLAALATQKGTPFKDAVDAFSVAAGSFRSTSLREYIEAADEVSLAQEAINRGLIKTEDEMNKNVAATVAMILINERAATAMGKVSTIQDDISGKYKGLTADIEDLDSQIGEKALPLMVQWKQAWLEILTFISNALIPIQTFFVQNLSLALAAIGTVKEAAFRAKEGLLEGFNVRDALAENYAIALESLSERFILQDVEDASDAFAGLNQQFEDGAPKVEDYSDAFDSLLNKLKEGGFELDEDIAREVRKLEDQIFEDQEKYNLKVLQASEKFQFDLEKINRDSNRKISEANDDYREKEIKSEEDFQEKLRKLREQFLLDLEDALRERDARQVLRLIREFNLRKTQLERERKQEQEDNRRRLEDQLKDIEAQRQARLEERRLEYEFQTKQDAKQYELQKKLRQEDHDDRIRELRIQAQERAQELLRAYANEYDITVSEAWKIKTELEKIFGPRGYIEGIYNYYIGLINNVAIATEQAYGMLGGLSLKTLAPGEGDGPALNPVKNPDASQYPGTEWWQRQSSLPSAVPEQSIPNINQASYSSAITSRVLVEMLLSPDLEGRIVDKSLNTVADVIFSKSRS